MAEVADVGIRARPLGIEDGQGGAEGQQRGAAGDIDSDPASEPDRGPPVKHRQQRDQAKQPQWPEQWQGKHEDVRHLLRYNEALISNEEQVKLVIAKLEEARRRLAADEPVKDAKTTVGAFIEEWTRKALPASTRRASTRQNYESIARTHLIPPPFGALPLDRLRPSDIEALLIAKRDSGLSSATVHRIYQVCRAALDVAVRDGIVRRNAAAAVMHPTVKRPDAQFLTSGDVGRLLHAARDDRLYPLFALMVGTGLRRGEALALHWRDVDLAARRVRVRWTLARIDHQLVFDEPKTERSRRFVPLPAPVIDVLKLHRSKQAAERLAAPIWQPAPGHDDLVFTTQVGTPIEPRNAARSFTRIAARAGLAGASLHTLRHSAASALIMSGTHIKVIQELLGHATYAVTADIYAHVAVEQQREAAERLGEAFPW